jgi:hypothetical protein
MFALGSSLELMHCIAIGMSNQEEDEGHVGMVGSPTVKSQNSKYQSQPPRIESLGLFN